MVHDVVIYGSVKDSAEHKHFQPGFKYGQNGCKDINDIAPAKALASFPTWQVRRSSEVTHFPGNAWHSSAVAVAGEKKRGATTSKRIPHAA